MACERLEQFAQRHGLLMRVGWRGPAAIAPDALFAIVIVDVRTAEPGCLFEVRSPPQRGIIREVLARTFRRRRAPSFSVMPRPAYMPHAEPFADDPAFDAAYVVRPATDAVRALLFAELRAALVAHHPCSMEVQNGILSMPASFVVSEDPAVESACLRAVRAIAALVRRSETVAR